MNNRLNTLLLVASSTLLLASCDESNESFETPNTSGIATNSGVISQKHFSLLTADINPAVFDGTTGTFTKTDVELTVFIGDRNNQTLTDAHTIFFRTDYGIIEPSCITENGACSVTWSAIKRPVFPGPGSDGFVAITAYTAGEEGFTDTNGNGRFDDGDTGFDDLVEPFIDTDWNGVFSTGDTIIDIVSANDPTGANAAHDINDGFFNGGNCTHSSLCSPFPSVIVFDDVRMDLVTNVILFRTIGGDVTGLTGTGLQLLNNSETLSIAADGPYTFPTTVADGSTYAVSVSTQPTAPGQVCTVASATGTVSANVTTADVTCVTTTYTIGGGITNLVGTGLVLQNNGGDNLTVASGATIYEFATAIDDSTAYAVTVLAHPTVPTQLCDITNPSAASTSADVIDADVSCAAAYTVGGTITGAGAGTETLVIQNNLGDNLTITADGAYTFTIPVADTLAYAVTIFDAPDINLNCIFTNLNATGSSSADIANVDIVCAP